MKKKAIVWKREIYEDSNALGKKEKEKRNKHIWESKSNILNHFFVRNFKNIYIHVLLKNSRVGEAITIKYWYEINQDQITLQNITIKESGMHFWNSMETILEKSRPNISQL